jgi:uncharacterized coiled-coil DUF342 family protein
VAVATTEELEKAVEALEAEIAAAQAAAEGNAATDVLVSEVAALKVKEGEYLKKVEELRVYQASQQSAGFNGPPFP